jgi:hypothetical protein
MRIPLALAAMLVLSVTLMATAPASAGPDCWKDPVTQQSPCSWTCDGGPAVCEILGLVLFPCEHRGINCP